MVISDVFVVFAVIALALMSLGIFNPVASLAAVRLSRRK
jgi:uncharacterized membrane protein